MNRSRTVGVLAGAGVFLAACSGPTSQQEAGETTDHFGYQLPTDVSTTNAGTMAGVSEMAQTLSGRLYPGVFVPGPNGQMIPNTDLATTQVLPGAQRRVIYTLNEAATFSDGAPVTCTDYLLAFKAGETPELFGSHMPLFSEVADLLCEPGSKEFTVVFNEGAGDRWRGLFGAGTVVPAHAVARKAGIDENQLGDVLASSDVTGMYAIAQAWRDGFDLATFDPEMAAAFGPYRIESVGEAGEVTLVANESYHGDAPRTPKLVVWPASADTATLAESGALRVAELPSSTPSWLDPNEEANPFDVKQAVGDLTDSLTFATNGIWAYHDYRRAFAACVDHGAVAAASSAASGLEVPPHLVHVVSANDALARRFNDIVDPHGGVDPAAASVLAGMEIRIGYTGSSARYAAMLEAVRASCEPFGVTVIDAGGDKTLGDLARVEFGEWGEAIETEGSIDVLLRPVDPATEYTGVGTRAQDIAALRDNERRLWEELPSIPLSPQPRNFVVDRNVGNVVVYTGSAGIGWNMDRWQAASPQSASMTENK
ncbi:ABC transporter substrate-binding protein [Corynebacterium sp.]|uniref:ABC transporter substrate-binding protein n=1 Tax=Corynebacterium sp. TaxID=1720 RepID=UPI002A9158A4|nr:ABC transporter substrate-binding protein [Corynebacterium sp.]MDY5784573.1 ABC transporter substrate-binding protein [Corynebacterium sp.]